MRILVTGASGFIGSKIAELAVTRGDMVYSCFYEHEPICGNPIRVDLRHRNSVKAFIRDLVLDVIIHTAALTDVDKCEEDRDLAEKINYDGSLNIAELAFNMNVPVIYCSTDYIFDGYKGFYNEEDKCNPINYYGRTKLLGENITFLCTDKTTIVRTSSVYGAKPSITGKVNFVLWVINKLRNNEEIKVVCDLYMSPTLDTNLAEMILEIADRKLYGVYHLAGERINKLEFARMIADVFGLNKELIKPIFLSEINWKAPRPKDSSLDSSKAMRTLNIKPMTLIQSLEKLKVDVVI